MWSLGQYSCELCCSSLSGDTCWMSYPGLWLYLAMEPFQPAVNCFWLPSISLNTENNYNILWDSQMKFGNLRCLEINLYFSSWEEKIVRWFFHMRDFISLKGSCLEMFPSFKSCTNHCFFKLKKMYVFVLKTLKQSVLTLLKFTLHLLWREGSDWMWRSWVQEQIFSLQYQTLKFPEEHSCPWMSVRKT